jgi:hypothetical protein
MVIKTESAFAVAKGAPVYLLVRCPPGHYATGGGYAAPPGFTASTNGPADGHSWEVAGAAGGESGAMQAYAVCVPNSA